LERAWHAASTVEAEADYLQARVRAGLLLQTRLELAAYLEHPAARLAVHGVTLPCVDSLERLAASHAGEPRVESYLARRRLRGLVRWEERVMT
jgi:hypothetical protein